MNDIDALPMELRVYINAFLLPKELMIFEMIHKNAAGQSQASYYQISRLSWENKFKTYFRKRYNKLLEENENPVKTLHWKRAFQNQDQLQHLALTFHQRHLFHVLKEDAIQTQDLIKALENLAKEKLSLIDLLLLNPIRDKKGLTPQNYAVKQKSRVAKNTFYQIIFEYYHQDLKKLDKRGISLLHWAVYLDQPECLQTLIEQGSDMRQKDRSGHTLLHLACLNGHIKTAMVLLKNGANIHEKDNYLNTSLHLAASYDHVEVAALLIENGASLHEENKWADTPLRLTCSKGHIKITELLIKNGASVHKKNSHGQTPLHWASNHGRTQAAALLIENGANIHEKNNNGETYLHWASSQGHTETTAFLLKNGAAINEKDSLGNTPLYWACRQGHIEVVKILLENGTDIEIKNKHGESAFDAIDEVLWIREAQKNDIRNLLNQALEDHQRKETQANDNISLENKEIAQPQLLPIGIPDKEEKSSINAFSFFQSRRNSDEPKTTSEQVEKSPEKKYKK